MVEIWLTTPTKHALASRRPLSNGVLEIVASALYVHREMVTNSDSRAIGGTFCRSIGAA
jgi:hypothetical protein